MRLADEASHRTKRIRSPQLVDHVPYFWRLSQNPTKTSFPHRLCLTNHGGVSAYKKDAIAISLWIHSLLKPALLTL
jgi:hypothetical protein